MFRKTALCGFRYRTISVRNSSILLKCSVDNISVKPIPAPYISFDNCASARQLSIKATLLDKKYIERENQNSHDTMRKSGVYSLYRTDFPKVGLITQEEYIGLINSNWSQARPDELLHCFKQLSEYARQNEICISEKVFDEFIDAFTDSLKCLTDRQLEEVFWYFSIWPEVISVHTRNFIEIWVALDDILCTRMSDWSIDKMLMFEDYICYLNLGRKSGYTFKLLTRSLRRSKYLLPHQLVQTLYYAGIRRSPNLKIQILQDRYADIFDKLTTDEHCIISIGLFKSQCRIRDHALLKKIILRLIDDVDIVSHINLSALLKIIRFSYKDNNAEDVALLLNSLAERIPELSMMCCTHIALLCQRSDIYDSEVLHRIFEKLQHNPGAARLKDLERIALTYGSLNTSQAASVYNIILNELKRPEREKELLIHGRTLACCLFYLASHVAPDAELVAKVLDKTFLEKHYGKNVYQYGNEILSLDNTVEIEVKDYTGDRLDWRTNKLLAKKYMLKIPIIRPDIKSKHYLTRMYTDIIILMQKIRGDDFVTCLHILPHFSYADILVGDDNLGNPLPTSSIYDADSIENYKIKRKPSEGTWFVLMPTDKKNKSADEAASTTYQKTKTRQLTVLGYKPIWISGIDWRELENEADIIKYLNAKMYGLSNDNNHESNMDKLTNKSFATGFELK